MNPLQKFYAFMKEDSLESMIVFLVLAVIVIKFIIFPGLSLLTGTALPLVIVESCSMHHHENGFETIIQQNNLYEQNNINLETTKNWNFQNGLNKGDVIFVVGANNLKIGDTIIFNGGTNYPIIHRLIQTNPYATKGDNYQTNAQQLTSEKNIDESRLIGKAVFKIPYIGWIKLIFFEPFRPENQKGLC